MGTILRLYLGRNHIHTIDQNAFRNMSNLVELKLTNNKLTTFPKIIGCPKLQRICLENNRLRRLRYDSFTQLNLEELMVSTQYVKVTHSKHADNNDQRERR